MTALRPSSLRHLTGYFAPQLRRPQRRWARVLDVRFVATQQTKDRILERYKDRLKEKAKQEGFEDISQLKEAYKDEIKQLRKKALVPGANAPLPQSKASPSKAPWSPPPPPPAQPLDQISPSSPNFTPPSVKTLSSYIDVAKSLELSAREIEALWRLMHTSKPSAICATIPSDMYSRIHSTARQHAQFVLPGLPGAEVTQSDAENVAFDQQAAPIHFLQWTFPAPDTATVMFTHLAEYKLRGEYAQPHTVITHHAELAGPKGLVLCQGNVIEGRGVSMDEAKWLLLSMQKFYNTDQAETEAGVAKELSKRRRTLMEQFSSGSSAFKLEELLDVAERIG